MRFSHRPRRFLYTCLALGSFLTFGLAAHAGGRATTHGLDLSAMDTSVKPCDDFFRYANGRWLDRTTIPAEYSYAGVDQEIDERTLALLHALADHAALDKGAAPNSPEGMVGSFYRSGMDQARIESDGVKPLGPEFAAIAAVHDVPSLEAEIGHLHRSQVGAAFTFFVAQDDKASDQEIAQVYQGGLGLPERGYYERTDKDTQATRDAYVAHVTKMFTLMGETPTQADADAGTAMALETRLALSSMTPVEQRDPQAVYHKMTLADLNQLTLGMDWRPYFTALGLTNPTTLNVAQPKFFATVGQMMTTVPLTDWKTYLRWKLVSAEAPRLNEALEAEDFHFYSTVLNGIPKQQSPWKRVLRATDNEIGDALGQLYVQAAFPPAAKARALSLVQNVKAALRDDLTTLPWMSAATRQEALAKLDAMAIKIGYPDKWRDYSRLDVSSPSYVVNSMRADEFEFQRNLSKIGRPVDRGEWGMTPPTDNAYYDPQMNDINFPAGILQPPYFDPQADDAVNYGEIGATIGHEMTHGFDDEGRQYDAHGNLHDWWTPEDAKNFVQRAQGIVAQYGTYEPLLGQHINGALTQGENIADVGGLKIAYLAFEKAMRGRPRVNLDGFTPEQRFFIAYGQSWRTKNRPESIKVSLTADPHSPARYRVLGPLADMPEFRQAFDCPPDPTASPTTIW